MYYVEYKSSGEGAGIKKRVSWSTQLTDQEAKEYTVENIFSICDAAVQKGATWYQPVKIKPFEWPLDRK